MSQLVNSPLRKPSYGQSGSEHNGSQKSKKEVTASADAFNYLVKRLKDQEERERHLLADLDSLKFSNNVLKQELKQKDDIINELKNRSQRCACRAKSRNISRGDNSHDSELSRK